MARRSVLTALRQANLPVSPSSLLLPHSFHPTFTQHHSFTFGKPEKGGDPEKSTDSGEPEKSAESTKSLREVLDHIGSNEELMARNRVILNYFEDNGLDIEVVPSEGVADDKPQIVLPSPEMFTDLTKILSDPLLLDKYGGPEKEEVQFKGLLDFAAKITIIAGSVDLLSKGWSQLEKQFRLPMYTFPSALAKLKLAKSLLASWDKAVGTKVKTGNSGGSSGGKGGGNGGGTGGGNRGGTGGGGGNGGNGGNDGNGGTGGWNGGNGGNGGEVGGGIVDAVVELIKSFWS